MMTSNDLAMVRTCVVHTFLIKHNISKIQVDLQLLSNNVCNVITV